MDIEQKMELCKQLLEEQLRTNKDIRIERCNAVLTIYENDAHLNMLCSCTLNAVVDVCRSLELSFHVTTLDDHKTIGIRVYK